MERVAFELFGRSVYWYGIFTALGFMVGYIFLMINRRFTKMSKEQPANLVILAAVAGIVGARIFYVVQFWDSQFADQHWTSIFRIDQGGQVFYGGFILASIAIILYCKVKKLNVLSVLDILTPSLAIGHAFGRVGCFINGCCFGRPTECSFGIKYAKGSFAYEKYHSIIAIHPVQLYEAFGNLVLFGLFMITLRKLKRGYTVGLYLIAYAIFRYIMEANFRGDHKELATDAFTKSEIVAMIIIPLGIAVMIFSYYYNKRNPVTTELKNKSDNNKKKDKK